MTLMTKKIKKKKTKNKKEKSKEYVKEVERVLCIDETVQNVSGLLEKNTIRKRK